MRKSADSSFHILLQHCASGYKPEKPTKDAGGEEDSKPNVQPHNGIWRLSAGGPERGLCGNYSVGSRQTEQPLHWWSKAWAGHRWDSTVLIMSSHGFNLGAEIVLTPNSKYNLNVDTNSKIASAAGPIQRSLGQKFFYQNGHLYPVIG